MIRKLFTLLIGLVLVLCVHSVTAETLQSLTLLVYMSGADLESRSGAASTDLDEMSAALIDDSVTVVVLTGGSSHWYNGVPVAENVLWKVTSEGLTEIERYPGNNFGDSSTLKNFLMRGTALFPANRYALIIWDHGAGPLNGVSYDERFENDCLTMQEIEDAFSDGLFAEQPLVFLGFDACLMATAEVAEVVAPYAEYMIASQEPEPISGWNYSFLSALDGEQDGLSVGKLIIDAYAEAQQETMTPATLSCIHLSGMQALRSALDEIFGNLVGMIDDNNYARLAACRNDTKVLGAATPVNWDLVDLLDLCVMLEEEGLADASELKATLEAAVVYSWANEQYVSGLSIYAPFSNKEKYSFPWAANYADLDFSTNYRSYVQKFASQWMGDSRVSWSDINSIELKAFNEQQLITAKLTDLEASDVADARLLVLMELAEGEYRLQYVSDSIKPVNGELTAVYRSEALYMLNDKDEILCGPLEIQELNEGIATFGLWEDDSRDINGIYITWLSDEYGKYWPAEFFMYNENREPLWIPIANPFEAGNSIHFGLHARILPTENLPYEQWPYGKKLLFNNVLYTGKMDWHLQYLPLQSNLNQIALFEIKDMQYNTHVSKPVKLENFSKLSLLKGPQTTEEIGLSLSLDDANLYTGASAGLELDFSLSNSLPDDIKVSVDTVVLDDIALLNLYTGDFNSGTGEKTLSLKLKIDVETLQKSRINKIKKVHLCLSIIHKYQRLDSAWFDFDLPVYLGLIVPALNNTPLPMAAFEQDGLVFELMELKSDNYGYWVGEMHLKNNSGMEKRLTETSCVINNIPIRCSIKNIKYDSYYVIPPDSESWFQVRIVTYEYMNRERVQLIPFELSDIKQFEFNVQIETNVIFNISDTL